MNKLWMIALLGLASLAQAQIQPEARALLEKALVAHGDDSLKNLSSVRFWQARYNNYGGGYDVAGVRVEADLKTASILQRRQSGDLTFVPNISEERLLTPEQSGAWGTSRLDIGPLQTAQREDLIEELYSGVLLLAQLGKIEKAELGEMSEVSGQKVNSVRLSIGDYATALLIADDGSLVGQDFSPTRRMLYVEYRLLDGIRWPSLMVLQTKSGSRWTSNRRQALLEVKANPTGLNFKLSPKAHVVYPTLSSPTATCACSSGLDLKENPEGWQVSRVDGGSLYAAAGLRVGDVLRKVNGHGVKDYPFWAVDHMIIASLRSELEVLRRGQSLQISLSR
jgi:hypothetical protein